MLQCSEENCVMVLLGRGRMVLISLCVKTNGMLLLGGGGGDDGDCHGC